MSAAPPEGDDTDPIPTTTVPTVELNDGRASDVMPAVNQIELHPYFHNAEVRDYDEARGIATQAWSPIAQGAVLDDPVITAVADKHDRAHPTRSPTSPTEVRGPS
jgi:hypothetical protein